MREEVTCLTQQVLACQRGRDDLEQQLKKYEALPYTVFVKFYGQVFYLLKIFKMYEIHFFIVLPYGKCLVLNLSISANPLPNL